MTDRWQHVEALYHAARERRPEERAAFLREACASDEALRLEVESLLEQSVAGSRLFESPHGFPGQTVPALSIGTHVGPYRINAFIGAGGMGEVYRAHDTTLGREVAIKVLPASLAADRDRRARFEREARLLASLNHPHIAHVFGIERRGGVLALAMELVPGQTLADRLERRLAEGADGSAGISRALNLGDALSISRQIVNALDAAHEKGIVHRDLKPANIKVMPDGTVKVLDFGLAKAVSAASSTGRSPSDDPIIDDNASATGIILGTTAYMSPEQARGLTVDKRTDIWAFGCVLYEMLTGLRPFEAETQSDTLARVLEREPDWAAVPVETPPGISALLRRCLEKDPRKRLRDIGDAGYEIDSALQASAGVTAAQAPASIPLGAAPFRRARIWWLAAAVLPLTAIGVWWLSTVQGGTPAPRVIPLTTLPGRENFPSLSPDGTQIAFAWDGGAGNNDDIYVQRIGSESPSRLTTDPGADVSPAWSPDGSQIAFLRRTSDRDALYLISPPGGSEVKLTDFAKSDEGLIRGAGTLFSNPLLSWLPDGKWLAVAGRRVGPDTPANEAGGIVLVAVDGHARRTLLADTAPLVYFESPAFSPDGRELAYAACEGVLQCRVYVVGLSPSLEVAGTPRRVSNEFEVVSGIAWSEDQRSVIYGAASVWLNTFHLWKAPAAGDRAPERIDVAGIAAMPSISTSSHRLAFARRHFDLTVWQVQEGRAPLPIVASSQSDYDAYFSPDGSRIAFVTDRRGAGSEVWTANADGSGLKSLTKGTQRTLGSPRWSPEGRSLAFDGKGEDGQWHIAVIDAEGGAPRWPAPKGFAGSRPSWSADRRWIYFDRSAPAAVTEVWRVPAAGGAPEQVTHGGGSAPFESPDGKTLYFLRRGTVYAMAVSGGPERKVVDAINGWQYMPHGHGLYYVAPRESPKAPFELRFLDLDAGKTRLLNTIQAEYFSNGLSVSPQGTVLVNGVTSIDVDLMLVEHFR